MKKIIFGIIATVSISSFSFAQATLEHSYQTTKFQSDETNAFLTDTGLKYYTLNNSTGTLLIYDDLHSLIKTVNIPIPGGYSLNYLYIITDKLFNTDPLIEFIISFTNNNADDPFIFTLINENGTILQQFGDKIKAYVVKGTNNSFKLITVSNVPSQNNGFYDYDIYSLPGTTLNILQNELPENYFFGFPNPAEYKIAITNNLQNGENGTLEVFDENGKKVIKKNVIGGNSEINLDVTELSNGVYIYKLNGQTNRFIKK